MHCNQDLLCADLPIDLFNKYLFSAYCEPSTVSMLEINLKTQLLP